MGRRDVYGIGALALLAASVLLLVFWEFLFAALAFLSGLWLLRLGGRVSPKA
jgi:hypothetical protein